MIACRRLFGDRTIKPLDRYIPEMLPPRRLKRTRTEPKPVEKLKAVRRSVWEHRFGRAYSGKCVTSWCQQIIDVWTFQVAHDVARSLGGTRTVDNLVPMCAECNSSMGTITLKEWNTLGGDWSGGGEPPLGVEPSRKRQRG